MNHRGSIRFHDGGVPLFSKSFGVELYHAPDERVPPAGAPTGGYATPAEVRAERVALGLRKHRRQGRQQGPRDRPALAARARRTQADGHHQGLTNGPSRPRMTRPGVSRARPRRIRGLRSLDPRPPIGGSAPALEGERVHIARARRQGGQHARPRSRRAALPGRRLVSPARVGPCAHARRVERDLLRAAGTDTRTPTSSEIRARVTARLGWVPRCRQRLLPAPLGLGEPRWVDDERFDIAAHVVQLTDPSDPVGPRALRAAARRAALPAAGPRPSAVAARVRPAAGRRAARGRRARAPRDGRRRGRAADRAADARHRRPRRRRRACALAGRGTADDPAARARPARARRRAVLRRRARRRARGDPSRAPPPATRCATPAGSSHALSQDLLPHAPAVRPEPPARAAAHARAASRRARRGARGQPPRARHAQRRRPGRDRRAPCARWRSSAAAPPSR